MNGVPHVAALHVHTLQPLPVICQRNGLEIRLLEHERMSAQAGSKSSICQFVQDLSSGLAKYSVLIMILIYAHIYPHADCVMQNA